MYDKIIHDFVRLTLSVRLNGPLMDHWALNAYSMPTKFVFVDLDLFKDKVIFGQNCFLVRIPD